MPEPLLTIETPHGPVRLEMRDPASLSPAPRNVMTHSDAEMQRLVGSISAHGFVEIPLHNERSGNIVAGHARIEAAAANHLPSIPVFVGDFDEADELAMSAALQGQQYGSWDDAVLTDVLRELSEASYDLDATGLEPFKIDELLGKADGDDAAAMPNADPDICPCCGAEKRADYSRVNT